VPACYHPGPEAKWPTAGEAGTIVQLFEWSWIDVANECENELAAAGFEAVQVSPAVEHIRGDQWWTRYQPVSFILESRSGSRLEFIDMIRRCNNVGVAVVVDTLTNHMAVGSGVGIANSIFGVRDFPAAGFNPESFHHLPGEPLSNCGVDDMLSEYNVQRCDLVGLPDLCTDCGFTQNIIAKHIAEVLSFGPQVSLRLDAAKHQNPEDLRLILDRVGKPWVVQEVYTSSPDERVQPSMYVDLGHVTEFWFARKVGLLFVEPEQLCGVHTFGESWGMMDGHKAVTFIDNHDTQRGEALLTNRNGAAYYLAVVFMLATPYGYPTVMSSFSFSNKDDGPPPYPVQCGEGWVCEHRRAWIRNMVGWRREAGKNEATNFTYGDCSQVAFSRSTAFIAINRAPGEQWSVQAFTGLPAGLYCDISVSDNTTVCPTVLVNEDGFASILVPEMSFVAIHQGCMAENSSESPEIVDWMTPVLAVTAVFAAAFAYVELSSHRHCQESSLSERLLRV